MDVYDLEYLNFIEKNQIECEVVGSKSIGIIPKTTNISKLLGHSIPDVVFVSILIIVILMIVLSKRPMVSDSINKMYIDLTSNKIVNTVGSMMSHRYSLKVKHVDLTKALDSLKTPMESSSNIRDISKSIGDIIDMGSRLTIVLAYSMANRLKKHYNSDIDISILAILEPLFYDNCNNCYEVDKDKIYRSISMVDEKTLVRAIENSDKKRELYLRSRGVLKPYFYTFDKFELLFDLIYVVGTGQTDINDSLNSLAKDFRYVYNIYEGFVNYYMDQLNDESNYVVENGIDTSNEEFYSRISEFIHKAQDLGIMTNGIKHIMNYLTDSVGLAYSMMKDVDDDTDDD